MGSGAIKMAAGESVATVERCLACEAVVNNAAGAARLLACCALLWEQTNIAT